MSEKTVEEIAREAFSGGPSTMMAVPHDITERIDAAMQAERDRAEKAEARIRELEAELQELNDKLFRITEAHAL